MAQFMTLRNQMTQNYGLWDTPGWAWFAVSWFLRQQNTHSAFLERVQYIEFLLFFFAGDLLDHTAVQYVRAT